MGMFDTLTCDYPLPGEMSINVKSLEFQTKSFECQLEKYHITPGGTLIKLGKEATESVYYSGELYFYTSNLAGAYKSKFYTKGGEDHYWLEYKATLTDGKVIKVELVKYTVIPALPIKEMWK